MNTSLRSVWEYDNNKLAAIQIPPLLGVYSISEVQETPDNVFIPDEPFVEIRNIVGAIVLHTTGRGESLRESGREIPLRFEGEVKAAGGEDFRQRKARVFKDPGACALCEVFPEADDVGVGVVPSWLGAGSVVPGR